MSAEHRVKYIIFDLSEVLLTGLKDTGIALREKHQLEVTGPKMDWAREKHPLLIPLAKEFFNGNVSEDEYIHEVIATYPVIGTADWLKQHIRENFREVEGTRDIVLRLRELGYPLAILSNHAKEFIDYCEEKFDFHKLFDARVYSYEIGVSKPDRRSFEMTLDQLHCTAETCLFIDDSEHNIEAAQQLGFQTILFTDAERLRDQLTQLLPDFAS